MSPLLSIWTLIALAGFGCAIEPFAVMTASNLTGANSSLNFNYASIQGTTGSFSINAISTLNQSNAAGFLSLPVTSPSGTAVNSTSIALIPCNSTDGQNVDSDPATIAFQFARSQGAYAILLYSTSAAGCALTGTFDPADIGNVYTLVSAENAATLLNVQNSSTAPLIGNFGPAAVLQFGSTPIVSSPTNTPTPPPVSGPTVSNTPIAIIVLGILAGILAILLGMFGFKTVQRARTHPELYGPRAATGRRPPQTRAHGLARAMLDTIPIVKFAAPAPADADKDVELADRGSVDTEIVVPSTASAEGDLPRRPEHAHVAANVDNGLCCSICTDDFEAGQDTRVLPCGHRFHPACIDPWLVGFSVSCPLCRVDVEAHMHPRKSDGEEAAPPREAAEETGSGSRVES